MKNADETARAGPRRPGDRLPGTLTARSFVTAAALLILGPLLAPGEPARLVRDPVAEDAYLALVSAAQDARMDFLRAASAARTDAQRQQVLRDYQAKLLELAQRNLAFARKYPRSVRAPEALGQAVVFAPDSETARAAVDRFLSDYPRSLVLGHICWALSARATPATEKLLRRLLEKSVERPAQAEAALGLARLLRTRAEGSSARDQAALNKEAEELLVRVVKRYADVKEPADEAGHELFELRELAIGKRAPDITGTDAAGKPLRLSDQRGKVVVLVFWAGWCAPCLEMLPHQRDLVKRLRGQPFVVLGINLDTSRAAQGKAEEQHEVPWRSWFDGREGPIARRWNVRGLPVVYVLDARGVIRFKHIHGRALDEAVASLLKEISDGKQK